MHEISVVIALRASHVAENAFKLSIPGANGKLLDAG